MDLNGYMDHGRNLDNNMKQLKVLLDKQVIKSPNIFYLRVPGFIDAKLNATLEGADGAARKRYSARQWRKDRRSIRSRSILRYSTRRDRYTAALLGRARSSTRQFSFPNANRLLSNSNSCDQIILSHRCCVGR